MLRIVVIILSICFSVAWPREGAADTTVDVVDTTAAISGADEGGKKPVDSDDVSGNSFTEDGEFTEDSLGPPDSLHSSPPVGSDAWRALQYERLVSGEDSLVEEAARALSAALLSEDFVLIQAMATGSLFQWEERKEHEGLVITGEEVADGSGFYVVPLFTVWPNRNPIPASRGEGKQILMSTDDLAEVETNRTIRVLLQEYLDKMGLFHDDAKKRRAASETMGNQGDSSAIPLLNRAIKEEKDPSILRIKQVSRAKLLMQYGDDFERLQAVRSLVDLKSPLAIPLLKKRMEADDQGLYPEPNEQIRAEMQVVLDKLKRFQSIMYIVQTLLNGLSTGSILILVALGLAIIYGLMGVINMAHGEFMMIGAYTTFLVQSLCLKILPPAHFDWFFVFSLPCSFIVAGFFGLVLEWLVIRHLYNRPLESLLATWGISYLLIQSARSLFGDLTAVQLPSALSGGMEVAPQVIFPYSRLFIIGLTVCIVLALIILFYRTTFGLKLRAVTQNRTMSGCLGIASRRVDAMTFFLGTGIAGIAGWAMTLIGNVVPNMGQTYIVDSFLVVVSGGVGSLWGTISAGMGIGMLTKILEPVFQAVYGKVIILGLIILFLQIKPSGLFATRSRGIEN